MKLEKQFKKIKKKTFLTLNQLGVSAKELEKDCTSNLFPDSNIQDLKDFIWTQFNTHLAKYSSDFQKQSNIYLEMARFNFEYEDGLQVVELKKQAMRASKIYNENILKNEFACVEIIAFPNSCQICMADDGKILETELFFSLDLLPHKYCSCEGFGCACTYGFVRKRLFMMTLY